MSVTIVLDLKDPKKPSIEVSDDNDGTVDVGYRVIGETPELSVSIKSLAEEVQSKLMAHLNLPLVAGEDPPVLLRTTVHPSNRPIKLDECVFAILSGILSRNVQDLEQDRERLVDEAFRYALLVITKLDNF